MSQQEEIKCYPGTLNAEAWLTPGNAEVLQPVGSTGAELAHALLRPPADPVQTIKPSWTPSLDSRPRLRLLLLTNILLGQTVPTHLQALCPQCCLWAPRKAAVQGAAPLAPQFTSRGAKCLFGCYVINDLIT